MAPKKRTSAPKHSRSMSPAASPDQRQLRHTGPSITGSIPGRPRASTSTTTSAATSKPARVPESTSPSTKKGAGGNASGGGAQDDKKQSQTPTPTPAEVPPPGAHTSLAKFTYVLLFVILLLFAWYIYGMVTLLERLKDEAGWWGIVAGSGGGGGRGEVQDSFEDSAGGASPESDWWRKVGSDRREFGVGRGRAGLEGSLNALADALGISPVEVASAVRPLVPKESLASVVKWSSPAGRSEAMRALLSEDHTTDVRGERDDEDEEGTGMTRGAVRGSMDEEENEFVV